MEEKERFDLVVLMGEIILFNGGEIFRANETMECAAQHFSVQKFSAFITANGIFASAVMADRLYSCQIRCISLAPISLCRVEAVNSLSREIAAGRCTPEAALEKVKRIRDMTVSGNSIQVFASGVGSGCFCYLLGGSLVDSVVAFGAGLLLYFFLLYIVPHTSLAKIMVNIIGSALVTLYSCIVYQLGWGDNLDKIIIGSIMSLVPGVPFTNSIRNFLENDFLSGLTRLVDALLVAGCIAIGVGVVIRLWKYAMGDCAL